MRTKFNQKLEEFIMSPEFGKPIKTTDYLGRELKVGDALTLILSGYKELASGIILRSTPKGMRTAWIDFKTYPENADGPTGWFRPGNHRQQFSGEVTKLSWLALLPTAEQYTEYYDSKIIAIENELKDGNMHPNHTGMQRSLDRLHMHRTDFIDDIRIINEYLLPVIVQKLNDEL